MKTANKAISELANTTPAVNETNVTSEAPCGGAKQPTGENDPGSKKSRKELTPLEHMRRFAEDVHSIQCTLVGDKEVENVGNISPEDHQKAIRLLKEFLLDACKDTKHGMERIHFKLFMKLPDGIYKYASLNDLSITKGLGVKGYEYLWSLVSNRYCECTMLLISGLDEDGKYVVADTDVYPHFMFNPTRIVKRN